MRTQKLLELMEQKLIIKKEELAKQQQNFNIDYMDHKTEDTFERNAISDLLIINSLKVQIKELQHWVDLLKIQESIDKADENEDN